MKRKWVVFAVLLVGLVATVALVLLARQSPVRITQESFDRIAVGMMEQEVEEIIGGPPGDYSPFLPTWTRVVEVAGDNHQSWVGEELIIHVGFDSDGRVVDKGEGFILEYMPKPTWVDRVRTWFGI
jgi:hypothetical protein